MYQSGKWEGEMKKLLIALALQCIPWMWQPTWVGYYCFPGYPVFPWGCF